MGKKATVLSAEPKPAAAVAVKPPSRNALNQQKKRFLAAFVIPPVALYTLFLAIPCILGLVLSFFNWKGITLNISFAGFDNYKTLFSDNVFYKALGNHLFIFIFNTVIVFALGIFLAILLSRSTLREKDVYRVITFFPTAVPMAVISVLWLCVYNPNSGLLNGLLELVGLPAQGWLSDISLVKGSVVAVMVWKSLGFYMVLFMAAVLNIPSYIFESAKIDGCSEVRQAFTITIPLMWEVIRTSLVFFVCTSCSVGFQVIFMMTTGGPDRASEILPTYMYQQAFKIGKYGYGATIGVAILVLTMTLALIILKVTERETYEL